MLPKDYSQEAAVVLQNTTKVKFENDGTFVEEASARIRVQSEAGVKNYGLLSFSYESAIGTFGIQYVRVLKPDGTQTETPLDTVQDMPSEITRQAPFYSDLHEKHVAVKGLGVGDILEYKTLNHVTKPLTPGQFQLGYIFQDSVIVLQLIVEVSVPRDRIVKYKSPDHKPLITESGNDRVYTWTRNNLSHPDKDELAQVKTTLQRIHGRFPAPDIQLTSFQSWDEIARWYRDLQAERVKPSPEIIAKAAELTKGLPNDDAKIRAIYDFVSLQFRYIGIAFGIGRYRPHFAAEVLSNQYGDCKDKHTLFASLLTAAGIKAYPVLISSERDADPDFPTVSLFNHVITAVPRDENLIFLDTTDEVGPFQFLRSSLRDKHALVVYDDKPGALATTPAQLPYPSSQNFKMAAKLDGDGHLLGEVELINRGDIEVGLREAFRATPMPQWNDLAQRLSQSMGFAGEVSDVVVSSPEKTSEPFRITYKYDRKDFGDWTNSHTTVPLPFINLPDPDWASFGFPNFMGEPIQLSFHSEMELPKGYSITPPRTVHEKHSFAEYDSVNVIKAGVLISDRHLRVLLSNFPSDQAEAYKKFANIVAEDRGSMLQVLSDRSPALPDSTATRQIFAMASVRDLSPSSNPQAAALEDQAFKEFATGQMQQGVASLYGATAEDPRDLRAWAVLGAVLMSSGSMDQGITAFQKALAVSPKETAILKTYAYSLMTQGKYKEAVPVWQQYVKIDADDIDGLVMLGRSFVESGQFQDAIPPLESAAKTDPDNLECLVQLVSAYSGADQQAKSISAANKLIFLNPPVPVLSELAAHMAQSEHTAPAALDIAQKAVQSAEKSSLDIELESATPNDESHIRTISNYWGALGLVQLKLGKTADAEKTLLSSWKLTQSGVAAQYLCDLYISQNKTQSALQFCRLAHSRLPQESEDHLYHIGDLLDQNNERLKKISPSSLNTFDMATADHIANMRDLKLPRLFAGQATADFLLQVDYDPQSNTFKVTDTKFVSGSPKLKPFSTALLKLNLNLTSPDGNPVRVLRRGTFLCNGVNTCEFMLPDANVAPSTQIKVQKTP